MTLTHPLLWAALAAAALDWLAVWRRWKTLEYLAKPGVMFCLLGWLWTLSQFQGALLWFGVALLASLVGDILLMLPRARFRAALGSFLLAHLAYIIGLNHTPPTLNAASLLLMGLLAVLVVLMGARLRTELHRRGHSARLLTPVLLYSAVISLMLASALLTLTSPEPAQGGWSSAAALLVSAGGFLFFFSDSVLVYGRFIKDAPRRRLLVHVSYHLGQFGLVAGALLHYLN